MPQIGLLAPYQSKDTRPRTFIPREVALDLQSRMCAEKISSKVYRLFPNSSVFPTLKPQLSARSRPAVPTDFQMPPLEVGGCVFDGPLPPMIHSLLADFMPA